MDPNQPTPNTPPTPPPTPPTNPVPQQTLPPFPGGAAPGGYPYAPTPQPTAQDPGMTLGIIGLVVGFLVLPVIGLVMCIIANNQSKHAGHSNTVAKIGMWIHGVLTALTVLFFGFLILISISASR